jgi:antitoxin component of RelBE/YafQ-DinJ toxin-antitoxin module
MHADILSCMQSTSVRVDRETHEELKRLARELGTTVGEVVAIAARRLRQQRLGRELKTPLTKTETEWLDADLG